ncbi:MAG: phosphoglucosamine mutase [Desulfuromonadaceae bacterium]|nr:phosphoglucosamine mutase [Desulfuromonadaceae bacterium]
MEKQLFGTDGVRGVANVGPLAVENVLKLGRAAAHVFKEGNKRTRIVIGKDTRISGYMIENALAAGICSMGCDVLLVGPLPTPGIAFITSSMRADAGVVISASHNPFEDNGIKFFCSQGFKLPDEVERKIEELVFSSKIDNLRSTGGEVGKAARIDDARGRYIVFIKHSFPNDLTLKGLKIVVDCAHGAAYKVAPEVLSELGAEVVTVGANPNGTNINDGVGSLHPEVVAAAVVEHQADLGLALDGDADRVIFVDEFGEVVDGDKIMAICGRRMLTEKRLARETLVATVMSNMGLEVSLRQMGGKVVRTSVGDRYVVEEMRRGGYNFGGEQSGHMIFLDHNTTGDGMISALQLLAIVQREQKSLAELAKVMVPLPQVLVNVRVREKREVAAVAEISRAVRMAEEKLGADGRILVRYSGTEPVLRVMLEGDNKQEITTMADEIAEVIRRTLG